jgi:hypothetical protein
MLPPGSGLPAGRAAAAPAAARPGTAASAMNPPTDAADCLIKFCQAITTQFSWLGCKPMLSCFHDFMISCFHDFMIS